jgi:hypothetical protein
MLSGTFKPLLFRGNFMTSISTHKFENAFAYHVPANEIKFGFTLDRSYPLGTTLKVTFSFQQRTTPSESKDPFHTGFYYWIDGSTDSGLTPLDGSISPNSAAIVQSHEGWTSSIAFGLYQVNSLATPTFNIEVQSRDLGNVNDILNPIMIVEEF